MPCQCFWSCDNTDTLVNMGRWSQVSNLMLSDIKEAGTFCGSGFEPVRNQWVSDCVLASCSITPVWEWDQAWEIPAIYLLCIPGFHTGLWWWAKIRKILHLMPSPHVAILIFLILIIFMYKVVNTLFSVLQICRKQLICSTSHRGERKKEDGCALLKLAWFGHDMFCTKRLVMPIIQQSAQQWRLGFNRVRFT